MSPDPLTSAPVLARTKSSDSAVRKVKCFTVHTFPPCWPQVTPLFPPCKIAFLEILQHRRSPAHLTHLGNKSGLNALCVSTSVFEQAECVKGWRVEDTPQVLTSMFKLWKYVTSKMFFKAQQNVLIYDLEVEGEPRFMCWYQSAIIIWYMQPNDQCYNKPLV